MDLELAEIHPRDIQIYITASKTVTLLGLLGFKRESGIWIPDYTVERHKMSDYFAFWANGSLVARLTDGVPASSTNLPQILGGDFPACGQGMDWCQTGGGRWDPDWCQSASCLELFHEGSADTGYTEQLINNFMLLMGVGRRLYWRRRAPKETTKNKEKHINNLEHLGKHRKRLQTMKIKKNKGKTQ